MADTTAPAALHERLPRDVKTLRALLRDEHDARKGELGCQWWRIARDAYQGTGGFARSMRAASTWEARAGNSETPRVSLRDTYLVPFTRESNESFASRADRSAYDNHVAPVVDVYHGHLARRRPKRTAPDGGPVATWWSDVTGTGTDIDEWMSATTQRAQLFGWCAALVDRPQDASPIRPGTRVCRLDPDEVRDWQIGRDGALDWIRLGSCWEEEDPADDSETCVEEFTIWTRAEWAHVRLTKPDDAPDDQWAVDALEGGAHGLGRVPVAILRWQDPLDADCLYGLSQVYGVVGQNLALFSNESEYAHHLANSNFTMLVVNSDDPNALNNLAIGTNNGMTYSIGATAPSFVSPASDVSVQYALRSEQIVRAIYAAAKVQRPQADASGGDAASGIARAYDFAQTDAVLQSFVRQLTRFEYDLADIVARWDRPGRTDGVAGVAVEYPTRFDARGIQEDLGAHFAIIDEKVRAQFPPEAVRQARLAIARMLFPEADDATMATITEQIDAMRDADVAALTKADAAQHVAAAIDALPPATGATADTVPMTAAQ